MVFKEMVAYLLEGGKYVCGNDIRAEKEMYERWYPGIQADIDGVRERHPDWTDERLHQYSTGDSVGQTFLKIKECLESHGYDTSTLPQVVVPEFGDIASLILKIGIGGTVIAGAYAANHLRNKGFGYKI